MRFDFKPSHLVLALAAAACAQASLAQVLTREQVQQQFQEARRSGDLASGESGLTLREQFPGNYPAQAKAPGRSRAAVEAELYAARQDGDLLLRGEAGGYQRDVAPAAAPKVVAAPKAVAASGLTREQVRAELMEAIRTGNMIANGETGLTLRELYPQQYESRNTQMAGMPDAMKRP